MSDITTVFPLRDPVNAGAPTPTARRTLVHVMLVSSARYGAEGIFLIRGFVLAHLLGPAGFGVWAAMRLLLVFSRYVHLGAIQGMVRLAPEAVGAGDRTGAGRYRSAAAGVALTATGLLGLGLLAAITVRARAGPVAHLGAWYALAGAVVLAQGHAFYQGCLRSEQRFVITSGSTVFLAASSTVCGLVAAWRFGLVGFVVALAVCYAAVGLGAAWVGRSFPRPRMDGPLTRVLIGTGAGIMGAEMLQVLQWNVDKLLLWTLADSTALGLYAVPTYVTNAILMLPYAAASVLYPHLLETLGRARSPRAAQPYIDRVGVALAQLACPALGLLVLLLHLPIRWLLPQYAEAIAAGHVLILATFFPIAAAIPAWVLIALDAQRRLLGIRLATVLLAACAVGAVLTAGGGLVHVALAAGAAIAVQAVLVVGAALRVAAYPVAQRVRVGRAMLTPFAALLLLLLLLHTVVPDAADAWQADVRATALRAGILLGAFLPWVITAARHLRAYSADADGGTPHARER